MAKRHKWAPKSKFKPRDRYCETCGLCETVTTYRYRTPRYGYKTGFRRRWYRLARVVSEGPRIPFDCLGSREAPNPDPN